MVNLIVESLEKKIATSLRSLLTRRRNEIERMMMSVTTKRKAQKDYFEKLAEARIERAINRVAILAGRHSSVKKDHDKKPVDK